MAEGGRYPWKIQKLLSWGPAADYSNIRKPLPHPPKGMVWYCDPQTREWSLTPDKKKSATTAKPPPKCAASTTTVEKSSSVATMKEKSNKEITDKKLKTELPGLKEEEIALVENLPPLVPRRESTTNHFNNSSVSGSKCEDEWELLSSGAGSNSNSTGGSIFVVKATGSVRSIPSFEDGQRSQQSAHTSHNTSRSHSFKIHRTNSNSTIDSADNTLGPSGHGVLGVDYVEHVILPTDTLQGICLAYKVTSTRLRQANHFSGHSLSLAPKKLVIPLSKKALRSGCIRVQDTDAKEFKVHALMAEFPDLSMTEAKAYLELADWILKDAVASVHEDGEWEKDINSAARLGPGEIRITMDIKAGAGIGFQGAGLSGLPNRNTERPESIQEDDAQPTQADIQKKKEKLVAAPVESMPAFVSKNTKPEDLVNAAHQHNNFGLELKPLISKKSKD